MNQSAKQITIKDIARKAGVSVSTVSCALNGSEKVKPQTKDRILDVAKDLNYMPNLHAKGLKKQPTLTVGVFFYELCGPVYSTLIKGLEMTAHAYGYDLVACSAHVGAASTAHKVFEKWLCRWRGGHCRQFEFRISLQHS